MIILSGNNLGERQRDLNDRVNKAVADKAFEKLKTGLFENDVDKIFMIDLAAKNKNILFLLEILKSGDVVHITRVLNKCTWLAENEIEAIINVDNLRNNVFRSMSIKMKKKFLSRLAVLMKNENRSIDFYEYCMKENLYNIAIKFLYNTPQSFKQDVILQKSKTFDMLLANKDDVMPNFIKDSFSLADIFLNCVEYDRNRSDLLDSLHYMYSLSNERYLIMLEKHNITEKRCKTPFGRRISKGIIKNYKDRVLGKPELYLNILNKDIIAKNSTIGEVKIYAVALLPDKAKTFWDMNFYGNYKFVLDIIPMGERFSFIKKIFTDKFSEEEFEFSKEFCNQNYFNTMTIEEKENWALCHIASGEESLGSGNDYTWYKFVRFDKAFKEIKKIIYITPDKEKRMDMINILLNSAKSCNDLEILLNYYYNRHINEAKNHKKRFLNNIIQQHNVFDFNEKCWMALEKIFYSVDVFIITNHGDANYRVITLIYYVIHGKIVLPVLNEFIDKGMITASDVKRYSRDLEPEKSEMVFQYILKFYLKSVEALSEKDFKDDVKHSIVRNVKGYLELLQNYSKTKDDIPDIMNKFIKLNWDSVKHFRILQNEVFSEKYIMCYMKSDATRVINEFPLIKTYHNRFQNRFSRTNWLINKLKIYFDHDIGEQYLQLLKDCLPADDVNYSMTQFTVYGIMKLADESYKIDFLQKHVPANPKIDHASISKKILNIQKAICSYACVSRPPLPMSCVHQYIAGDYVHSCLPMFNTYLMNLPLPECIAFVESLINKPISIQKHGLRLAFECFSTENLTSLINKIWQNTKNVSLRKILYNSLYEKILKETGQTQLELFEVLNTLTLSLHQDDDDELFLQLCSHKMPVKLRGKYLVNAWKVVKNLPERCVNFERMTRVLIRIKMDFKLVPENEIIIITDDHISKMLDEKEVLNSSNLKDVMDDLLKAKWNLTLASVSNVYNETQLERSLGVVRHIIKRCLEMWNEGINGTYVIREFCRTFIEDLETTSYNDHEIESYNNMKIIYDTLFNDLKEHLPEHEIYTLLWQLRLSNITRDIIIVEKTEMCESPDANQIAEAIVGSLLKFSENFVVLLKEYINNGKYFAAFHEVIESFVIRQLEKINTKFDVYHIVNFSQDDLIVILCSGLLKFEMPEVYLLIVRLLPVNYTRFFVNEYEKSINIVKVFKNTEIQYYMYEKFNNLDLMFKST